MISIDPHTSNDYHDDLSSLIELGTHGLFPIFYPEWIREASQFKSLEIRPVNLPIIARIEASLMKHKSIERKRTFMMSLTQHERTLFIINFLSKVETRILARKPAVN